MNTGHPLPDSILDLVRNVGADLRREMKALAKENPLSIDPIDLGGACAISSFTMGRILRALGIRTELRCGPVGYGQHCWLVISGTPIIVDVTLTQFELRIGGKALDEVYIGGADRYPEVYADAVVPDWMARDLPNGRDHAAVVRYIKEWDGQSPFGYRERLRRVFKEIARKHLSSRQRNAA